jgi:hypothetical protein
MTPAKGWRAINWQLLVATISLIAALIFNSLSARDAASQAKRSANANELGLLQTINGSVVTTIARIQAEPQLQHPIKGHLRPSARSALVEALNEFDYLAWLYNHHHLTSQDARRYWYQPMRCVYETGRYLMGAQFVTVNFAELSGLVAAGRPCAAP